MSTVTVVAQVTAKKDAVDAVKAELLKLVPETRKEEGCLEYRLHQDRDDPATFVFYENWKSPEHLEQHMKSKHFQEYVTAVEAIIAGKAVHVLAEIA